MKQRVKRTIAGLLALSMCVTAVPITITAGNVQQTTQNNTQDEDMYTTLRKRLAEIADCLNLPYFMVSEGDTVYINGEQVATTTVPIDRDLAFSGEYKKYWLDVTAFGDYDALVEAANKLNAYIDSTRAGVTSAENDLKSVLKTIRSICVSSKLAKHNAVDSEAYKTLTDGYVYATNKIQLVRPESSMTDEKAPTIPDGTVLPDGTLLPDVPDLETMGVLTAENFKQLQGTGTRNEYDAVERLMSLRISADTETCIAVNGLADSIDVKADMRKNSKKAASLLAQYAPGDAPVSYELTLLSELSTAIESFDETLTELMGDDTLTGDAWIEKCLETQSLEELAYACSVISTNLKLINTYEYYLTEKTFDFYNLKGEVLAQMTLPEYFSILGSYNYVQPIHESEVTPQDAEADNMFSDIVYSNLYREYSVVENSVDWSTVETATSYSSFADTEQKLSSLNDFRVDNTVIDRLDAETSKLLSQKYADCVSVDDNVYTYNTTEYTHLTDNKIDVTTDSTGVLKAYTDKRDGVIANMPANLTTAWFTFYDTTLGYDAFTEPADPTPYKATFDSREATLNGSWDFGASQYDAVKYVTDVKEENGVPSVTKRALTDEQGNNKHYGKQNEVTPWINWQYLVQYADDSKTEDKKPDADALTYEAYAVWATHETYRNLKPGVIDEEWLGPKHPEKYTVENSPDMTAMLKERGYAPTGNEEFKSTGVRVTVSKYDMDGYGVDDQDVYSYVIDFSQYPDSRYNFDVVHVLEQLYEQEVAQLDDSVITEFQNWIKAARPDIVGKQLELYTEAYKHYITGFNAHTGYAFTLDYVYECDGLATADDSAFTGLTGVNKVLLTEIPEYSISEYYEDKEDYFKLSDLKSNVIKPDSQIYELFADNPAKLYNADTKAYNFTSALSSDWEYMLSNTSNRSLGYVGSRFTVPTGVSVTLPAYIPVNGRTVDTRYYVRYIPYAAGITPTPDNTAFYAVDMTSNISDAFESIAEMTAKGAPAYKTLNINADKTGYYTTFYALDRGVNRVSALQRIMTPIVPFTVTGDNAMNLNKHLKVKGVAGTDNGYQDATMGAAVAEQGLPVLIWDTLTGTAINQNTNTTEFDGDVHLWVSKSTDKDGIIVADWVNSTPSLLQGALKSTNVTNGVYSADATKTSVEKPSTSTAGKAIQIKSGLTKGTFADWAFTRVLTNYKMPYCTNCHKFIADVQNHREMTYYNCEMGEMKVWISSTVTYEIPAGDETIASGNGWHIDKPATDPSTGKPCEQVTDYDKMKDFSGVKIPGIGKTGAKIARDGDKTPQYDKNNNPYIGGFEWKKGVNKEEGAAVAEAIRNGAKWKVGDKVPCYATDPKTGKTIVTEVTVTEEMLSDKDNTPSEPEPPSKPDKVTVSISVPVQITITLLVYVPHKYPVCTGQLTYVDVWTLVNGNSPYKAQTANEMNQNMGSAEYVCTGIGAGTCDPLKQYVDKNAQMHWWMEEAANDYYAKAYGHKPSGQTELYKPIPERFGTWTGNSNSIAAVIPLGNLNALYGNVKVDGTESMLTVGTYKKPLRTYRDKIAVNVQNWNEYVDLLVGNVVTESSTDGQMTETNTAFEPTTLERLSKAMKLFSTGATAKLASVNAIVCPTLGINNKVNETLVDVTAKSSNGEKGTLTVKLPEMTYVPYIVTNNINGVTKTGANLDYTITSTTKTPRTDIFGVALNPHEYRTENYTSQYKTNLVPEVLMTYKDSFLDESGNLLSYENRGALNSLYIAGYNKYSLDLPMYNKASITYDITSDAMDTVGAATAKSSAAKKLVNNLDVLYTGTEVSTLVDEDNAPSVDFRSYVLDFVNPNVGTAWNADYTATTAQEQAQAWLNTYKGTNPADTDSFAYTANLNVTYSTSPVYTASSNAENSTVTSTIAVDGKQMQPIEVTQDYTFDLTNANGGKNAYALLATYPVTIRNGRLATVSVDKHTYVLYGDGNITTTAQLMENTNFQKLRTEHPDVAEAIANMQLPEFASTLSHNKGSQNWQTYKDNSIYTDNTTKTVPDEVGEERSAYDANYANASGWYSEDTTVLAIKLYGISGEIDNHYAFTYKIPLDYGYKSPRNKSDLFKSGTALYAYNELYFTFANTAQTTDTAVLSGTYDIVGDEGVNQLVVTPTPAYVISNATVNDMTR